jgi:hypothetical protein
MGLPPKDTSSTKVLDATFTIGAEATDVINVAIQLEWASGEAVDRSCAVLAYLSDNADGSTLIATAHSGGAAIGTDGLAIEVVADKAFWLISESDGDIDINLTHVTTAKTAYLVVVLPSGDIVVSDAIAHVA